MNSFTIATVLLIVLFGLLITTLIRQDYPWRNWIGLLFIVGTFSYASWMNINTFGKPIELDYFKWATPSQKDYILLGHQLREGDGIYVLVQLHGSPKMPTYYKFPWTKELAEKIQEESERKKNQHNGQGVIKFRFHSPSLEWRNPTVELELPPALPTKKNPFSSRGKKLPEGEFDNRPQLRGDEKLSLTGLHQLMPNHAWSSWPSVAVPTSCPF